MFTDLAIAFFSFVVACVRLVWIPGHAVSVAGSLEAFSHIWCGYLIAVIIYCKPDGCNENRNLAIFALLAITAEEAIMFFVR